MQEQASKVGSKKAKESEHCLPLSLLIFDEPLTPLSLGRLRPRRARFRFRMRMDVTTALSQRQRS